MSNWGRPTRIAASDSAVDLSALLSRRLVFVTGKGGTGKSTVTAAIARLAARSGLRTLACEMDAKGALAAALGVPTPGFVPAEVEQNLWAMTMDTESSLREYLRVHLRVPFVARLGPLASTFDFVADAAPGVKEVLAVGKVCWEVRENHYDLVVVDAEASGHIASQIASPRIINSLVGRGPLGDQTRWMLDILDDPARCAVVIVANPEDMVVTESLDLMATIRNQTKTEVSLVVMNRCEESPMGAENEARLGRLMDSLASIPAAVPAELTAAATAMSALVGRAAEAARQVRRLVDSVAPVPVVQIPVADAASTTVGVVDHVMDALGGAVT